MEFSRGLVLFKKIDDMWKVLLVKQINDNYGFPKGHVIGEESDIETALRETREEVGITDIIVFNEFNYTTVYFVEMNNNYKEVIYFLAIQKSDEKIKILPSEIKEANYYDFKSALKIISHKDNKKILKKAYKDLKKESKNLFITCD
ncbi:bis(5'-nucleosyl)-tetraphosphatase [Mycoplasmopsis opalescens]|uniref:bis(5'-nucleosyl)-tetraphosphatase n=1 Tax=Mycoplasmopsis opalescens TaxID=114886 RepID=UPI0004A6FC62|nr:NUDIX domain-containing protein [Mycoplasmopsis opalescens]